jgi:hypothetical protein
MWAFEGALEVHIVEWNVLLGTRTEDCSTDSASNDPRSFCLSRCFQSGVIPSRIVHIIGGFGQLEYMPVEGPTYPLVLAYDVRHHETLESTLCEPWNQQGENHQSNLPFALPKKKRNIYSHAKSNIRLVICGGRNWPP